MKLDMISMYISIISMALCSKITKTEMDTFLNSLPSDTTIDTEICMSQYIQKIIKYGQKQVYRREIRRPFF